MTSRLAYGSLVGDNVMNHWWSHACAHAVHGEIGSQVQWVHSYVTDNKINPTTAE